MVAEFVARQHSGSPINGETPHPNHNNSNMPTNGHNNNGSRNGMSRNPHHMDNMSASSSPTNFLHESHTNGSMIISNGPMSPNSQDGFPPGYDIAAHLKRKELFTQRKQREFIPDNKKDDSYWDRRRRNNEAAKRSREKRRFNDMVLEQRVVELTKENHVLKAQLDAIKDKYNICGETLVSVEQIMATLPTTEQVLSITKRAKLSNGGSSTIIYPQSPSPTRTGSVIHQPISSESPSPSPQMHQLQRSQSPHTGSQVNGGHIRQTHHYQNNMSETKAIRSCSPMRSIIMENTNPIIRPEVFRPNVVNDHFHNSVSNGHSNGNALNMHGSSIISSNNGNSNHIGNGNAISRFIPYNNAPSALNSILQNDSHPYDGPLTNGPSMNANGGTAVSLMTRSEDMNTLEDDSSTNVLNLSRRRNGKSDIIRNVGNVVNSGSGPTSPYEISSGGGSSTTSGDDEQCLDNQPITDTNNSLPLKLRHKSHLGDKDAATALLALQHIKQEPNLRLSPPWDGEGSSDERDSGISIGAAEWAIQRKIMLPNPIGSIGTINGIGAAIGNLAANLSSVGVVGGLTMGNVLGVGVNNNNINNSNSVKEENIHLKSQIARLESEVASIKNMMILSTNTGSTTTVQ